MTQDAEGHIINIIDQIQNRMIKPKPLFSRSGPRPRPKLIKQQF